MARNVENVKVAVRVRFFNDWEKKLGSVLVVSMVGNQTIASNTKEGTKKTFPFVWIIHIDLTMALLNAEMAILNQPSHAMPIR